NGSVIMNDGSVIQNCSALAGGAVAMYNSSSNTTATASFTMNGGTLRNNTATQSGVSYGGGAVLINLDGGVFTMNGGTIIGNQSAGFGGAVHGVHSNSVINMTAGEISENHSVSYGGGIYGTGTMHLSGGSIAGNTTDSNGAGVAVYKGTANLRGDIQITQNTKEDGAEENLWLYGFSYNSTYTSGQIHVINALSNNASIGISCLAKLGVTVVTGTDTYTITEADASKFYSDNTAYRVDWQEEDNKIVLAKAEIPVTGITLDQAELTLTAGESAQLTATVQPENATNPTVTWSSNDEDVATVDDNGNITAVGVGTATITAQAGDQTATCVVTATPIARTISVSGKADSPTQITLEQAVIDLADTSGAVTYAVYTENTAPEDGWQESTVFTDLKENTTYYCFAKVAADGNYAEAVSEGYCITTPEKTVSGIEVASQPDRLNYVTGDVLDLSGLAIQVSYNDNTSEMIDDLTSFTLEPANGTMLTVSEHDGKPVIITYGGKSCTTDNLTVGQGAQAKLSITGVPESVTEDDSFALQIEGGSGTGAIVWTVVSGNAMIDENGVVTVTGAGEIQIKATKQADTDYEEATATVIFIAEEKKTPDDPNKPCDGGDNCPSRAFVDLNTFKWYHEYTDYVITHDLMQGTSDSNFEPNGVLSRAMLTQIIYNMEGQPDASGNQTFSDVSDAWYTDAIAWATEEGVIYGYGDGTFGPNDSVTRQDMACILQRYAVYKGYDVSARAEMSQYIDKDAISTYAVDAMSWVNATGIIVGTAEDMLSPKDNATRAQVATVMTILCKNIVR
ncbi:MAG: S-layer homology domain-containing protein, partial [Eubacteriales bacterium]|nr:S-layer homology domain-containing protein [Eubacteriales bacterium]